MPPPIHAGKKPPAIQTIPDDLIFEILTWLPGKPVARFKCVCKDWLSTIGSDPFRKAYRSRNRILLMYRCEEISGENSNFIDPYIGVVSFKRLLRFSYSPLRRLNEPRPDFRPLVDLEFNCLFNGVTQPVNGIICHCDCRSDTADRELTIQNVFTGEKMKVVPDPAIIPGRFGNTVSTYHLGYAVLSAKFEILRLVFTLDPYNDEVVNLPVQAFTIGLNPSGSDSAWKKIRKKDSGFDRLLLRSKTLYKMVSHHEVRTYCFDGNVCWFRPKLGLVLFNFHFERFRRVMFPKDIQHSKRVFVRTAFNGYCSIALYVLSQKGELECFVLDDYFDEVVYEDDAWRKEDVEFPAEIQGMLGALAVADGDETLLFMETQETGSGIVYGYGDDKSVERFRVGDLPYNAEPLDLTGKGPSMNHSLNQIFDTRLSCLHDSSVLYRSMNDVLTTWMR